VNREILPTSNIDATVRLPGSKYIANRLIPLCALAKSQSNLTNVVDNNDINTAIKGLSELGYLFLKQENKLVVLPRAKSLDRPANLYTAHSGTFSRFVCAIAALEKQPVFITCSDKMATRPMSELFNCLKQLQVTIGSKPGSISQFLPATIKGPFEGDECDLDASRSSQYLSALLVIAPLLDNGLKIHLSGELVSKAYVDMTIKLMAKMGVQVEQANNTFSVEPEQSYQGIEYEIPCDPVSSTYFIAAVAIAGGRVTIEGFDFDSVQGESEFSQVLEAMGAKVERNNNQLTIVSNAELNAIEVDMGNMPDAVQTLAVVACFAKGTTRITNIAHLAYKESNRIEDTATELRKVGIKVKSGIDFLEIVGGKTEAAVINTHDDHRMAMSMALLGIRTSGIKILDAQVVEKSFPEYWGYLTQIGLKSKAI